MVRLKHIMNTYKYSHFILGPKRDLSSYDSLKNYSLTCCCAFTHNQCVMFLTRAANIIVHDVAAAVILCCYCEATGLTSVQDICSSYYNMSFSLLKVSLKFESFAWIQYTIDRRSTGHYHMSYQKRDSLVLSVCLVRAGRCLFFLCG